MINCSRLQLLTLSLPQYGQNTPNPPHANINQYVDVFIRHFASERVKVGVYVTRLGLIQTIASTSNSQNEQRHLKQKFRVAF